jgi:hypothetical protein
VSEWFKETVLKTVVPAMVPRVRIPASPPEIILKQPVEWAVLFVTESPRQRHGALLGTLAGVGAKKWSLVVRVFGEFVARVAA